MKERDAAIFPRILAAIDQGGPSDHGLVAAARLARALGSELRLVHAFEIPTAVHWPGFSPDAVERVRDAALRQATERLRQRLAREAAELGLDARTVAAQTAVVAGLARDAVLAEAASWRASLLVLGGHRRRGLLDFGSTARAVLARSPIPVWIQPRLPRDVRRILAAVDLSEHSLRALAVARDLARALGATLCVLHAYEPLPVQAALGHGGLAGVPILPPVDLRRETQAAFERELGRFDWKGLAHERALVDGGAADAILAAEHDRDLVVLGTHGRSGLERLLLGSVAYAVLRGAQGAVLAVPPKAGTAGAKAGTA
jgi:nucleotide-binding universal stress UspA family protein